MCRNHCCKQVERTEHKHNSIRSYKAAEFIKRTTEICSLIGGVRFS